MRSVEFDFRQRFKDNWIVESPLQHIGIDNQTALRIIKDDIAGYQDAIDSGFDGITIEQKENLTKISSSSTVIYFETNVTFGVKLEKHGQNYFVTLVAKDESNPKHVSDLYIEILNDLGSRIISDKKQTLGGFKIWKYLFRSGASIGVIEADDVNSGMTIIRSEEELDSYFGTDSNNSKFNTRYVLGTKNQIFEAWEQFSTRHNRSKAICEDGSKLTEVDDQNLI
jgi:hypothetical protein